MKAFGQAHTNGRLAHRVTGFSLNEISTSIGRVFFCICNNWKNFPENYITMWNSKKSRFLFHMHFVPLQLNDFFEVQHVNVPGCVMFGSGNLCWGHGGQTTMPFHGASWIANSLLIVSHSGFCHEYCFKHQHYTNKLMFSCLLLFISHLGLNFLHAFRRFFWSLSLWVNRYICLTQPEHTLFDSVRVNCKENALYIYIYI